MSWIVAVVPCLDPVVCLLIHMLFDYFGIFPVPVAFITVSWFLLGSLVVFEELGFEAFRAWALGHDTEFLHGMCMARGTKG